MYWDFRQNNVLLETTPITFRLLDVSKIDNPVVSSVQFTDIILDASVSNDIIIIASCNGVRFLNWELKIVNKRDYPYHILSLLDTLSSFLACSLNFDHSRYLISDDNTIYEVEYMTHRIVAGFRGHHGTVHSLRYSPQGKYFISGSDDSSIRLWPLNRT